MARIRNLIQRRIITSINRQRGIINYDNGNDYPQKILKIINDSGRATLCCDMYSRFLEGLGFNKEGLNDLIVNRSGETSWDILQKVAEDFSMFYGFAISIQYNMNFDVIGLYHIPFEYTRLCEPDDIDYVGRIAVYNNWDKSKKRIIKDSDIDLINIYNPNPDIIQAQVDKVGSWTLYKGQIFWFSKNGPSSYPLSPLDPVLEDCVTDSQIKAFKYNNVTTSFMASHMLITKGKPEGVVEEDDLEKNLIKFQGADNASKILHVEVEYDEQIPELRPFETINNDRLFQYTESSVHENIRKQFLIPPVLAGDLIAGKLGTSEEIYDAYALYNTLTKKDRNTISRAFTKIFEFWIENLGIDFSIAEVQIDFKARQKTVTGEVEKQTTEEKQTIQE